MVLNKIKSTATRTLDSKTFLKTDRQNVNVYEARNVSKTLPFIYISEKN